jgi:antitoxin HicB
MEPIGYPATFIPDAKRRPVVQFVDLREAKTDGRDMAEATAEAEDCLGSALAARIARREPVPRPSKPRRGEVLVPVPLWLAPKLALYWTMHEQGISNSELARRLGVRETVVRRMLDPDHETKAEKIQQALLAVGKRVLVAVDDAA